jgi:hypothetical protein
MIPIDEILKIPLPDKASYLMVVDSPDGGLWVYLDTGWEKLGTNLIEPIREKVAMDAFKKHENFNNDNALIRLMSFCSLAMRRQDFLDCNLLFKDVASMIYEKKEEE